MATYYHHQFNDINFVANECVKNEQIIWNVYIQKGIQRKKET